jgi:hypothetical protein
MSHCKRTNTNAIRRSRRPGGSRDNLSRPRSFFRSQPSKRDLTIGKPLERHNAGRPPLISPAIKAWVIELVQE